MLNIKTYKPEFYIDLIERIWLSENTDTEIEVVEPPSQYINLIIPLKGSNWVRDNEFQNTPKLQGISLKGTQVIYPANTKLIGIRFYAFGLYPFLPIAGKESLNKSIDFPFSLEKVYSDVENSLLDLETNIWPILHSFLNDLFDLRAYQAIKLLHHFYNRFRWDEQTSSIETYCEQTGTNYSALNRTFTRITGISTKKFERLIKFRKSLCSLIDSQEKLTQIGIDSGYFDQAHFIREFKLFLNTTPSQYHDFLNMAEKEGKIINYNFRLL
jgi:AraC-like DNA-binding protein